MNSFQPLKAKFFDRDHFGSIANTPWNTNMAMGKSTRTNDASTQMFHLQGLGSGKPGSITPCLSIGRFLKVSCPVAIKVTALGPFMLDIWVNLHTSYNPIATHILNACEFIQWQWQQPPLLSHCSYRYDVRIYIYTFGTSEYKKVFLPGELLTINHPSPFFGMENRPGIVHVFIQRGAKRADIA